MIINQYILSFSIVGGIYTVIRSKAQITAEELGDHYCLIGPMNEHFVRTEVEVLDEKNSIFGDSIQCLKNFGIHVIYGRWLIEGVPQVILFDIGSGKLLLTL